MSTWGVGVFDDDFSLDWIDKIVETEDADDVLDMFESIFVYALDTNYVSHEDCCAVTASCGVLDMLQNGTVYPTQEQDIQEWVAENEGLEVPTKLAKLGAQALVIMTSKKSELNELWQDNTAEYDKWKMKIDKLAKRLKARKKK